MYFRILKKDLRRKKSINLILLVFIFLSTMFIAGSLNNFSVIIHGVDDFMERAGVADFLIVTMEGSSEDISQNDKNIEEFLKEQENVTGYVVDDNLFLTENQVKGGKNEKITLSSSVMISSFDIKGQKFFDKDNQEITRMEDGTIYVSHRMMADNHLRSGDRLTIHTENGYQKELEVIGEFKDAFLGSSMMGMQRFIISQKDYQKMLAESGLPYGRIYSIACNDLENFRTDYNNCDFHSIFGDGKAMIKMTYIMEMVIAAVILMVSICLIAIAVVMLRFTIVFTVNEDYKEIGIMKAIGMGDAAIRKLYMIKYAVLAVTGAGFGFIASIPFSRLLLKQVTEEVMIQEGGSGIVFQFAVSVLVVGVVVLFGYQSTGKIKKFTPMDAIRSGNNGERFRRKGVFHLKGSHMSPTTFLACNDVLSEIRKYFVLFLTSMIGVWLVVMPVNTINTLKSDEIAAWFGLVDSDICVMNEEKVAELIMSGKKQEWYDYMEDTKELLEEHGIEIHKISTEAYFKLKIRKEDVSCKSFALQGLGTSPEQYFYDEGEAPVYDNEIAITHIIAEKIGAKLGDIVYITSGNEEKPYIVTAIYQSMNNMGEGIRFTEDAALEYKEAVGSAGMQIVLEKEQDKKELSATIEKVEKLLADSRVETLGEFIDSTIGGIAERLDSLKILILAIVLAINILVVVLMQRMFLIRERGEIGMLKSIGFSNGAVTFWQAKRVMLVLFFGILAGTITGTPFSQITSGQVFKMMGASRIEFVINPLEIYALYPAVLFLATVTACVIAMQKIRNISVQEMNNID